MAMICIENLTFGYPGAAETVFEGLDLRLDTRWRLGVIGRNGRGKTTLLRLLAGEYPYQGRILAPVEFVRFPAPVASPDAPVGRVLADAARAAQAWQRQRELSLLGMEAALERPFSSLSGGERTKVLLAALFLNEGAFPLIDEPTNHLDAAARLQVAAYLRRKEGFVLVSHDRCFLDGCVDHILAFNRSGPGVQSGNFSVWFENYQRRQADEQARNQRLQKQIGALRQAARRTADWSARAEKKKIGAGPVDRGYIGHKAAKMMQRAKAIEARRQRAAQEKQGLLQDLETAEPLKLAPLPWPARPLAELREAAPVYGGRPVCAPVTFSLHSGERLALDGPNGAGKSSLLRLLAGQGPDHTGLVRCASGLVVSVVPQETGGLRGSLAGFCRENGLDESLFKAILRKMDFSRAQFEAGMEDFSEGQKKKVLLARSLCQRAHLYLWDEPLNYIDLFSRMQIEELLEQARPTMVFVEHDAAFRQRLATRVLRLERP